MTYPPANQQQQHLSPLRKRVQIKLYDIEYIKYVVCDNAWASAWASASASASARARASASASASARARASASAMVNQLDPLLFACINIEESIDKGLRDDYES